MKTEGALGFPTHPTSCIYCEKKTIFPFSVSFLVAGCYTLHCLDNFHKNNHGITLHQQNRAYQIEQNGQENPGTCLRVGTFNVRGMKTEIKMTHVAFDMKNYKMEKLQDEYRVTNW